MSELSELRAWAAGVCGYKLVAGTTQPMYHGPKGGLLVRDWVPDQNAGQDYEVLSNVREAWNGQQCRAFADALSDIIGRGLPAGHAILKVDLMMQYKAGDYSRAAWAATKEGQL